MNHTAANDVMSLRGRLLREVESLPVPSAEAFQAIPAPGQEELGLYRLIDDPNVRFKLANAKLIEVVQKPGPGSWTKRTPPPHIAKVYPNFDAPAKEGAARRSASRSKAAASDAPGVPRIPPAIVNEIRQHWEAYYVDSRPENQRRHAERAQHIDPGAISTRAMKLIADARKKNRTLPVREAMFAATDELTADFETAMRRKYGDLVVDLLGIPDATDR